jgi:hypothetical protein
MYKSIIILLNLTPFTIIENLNTYLLIYRISQLDSRENCEVRLYENLFKSDNPNTFDNILEDLNEKSLTTLKKCKINKNL